jgi:hypothetical protein
MNVKEADYARRGDDGNPGLGQVPNEHIPYEKGPFYIDGSVCPP